MQRDKNRSSLRVRSFRTVIKGGIIIRLAREQHAKPLRLQRNSKQASKTKNNFALSDTRRSARPLIRASMRRVQNDHGQCIARRGRWRGNWFLNGLRRLLGGLLRCGWGRGLRRWLGWLRRCCTLRRRTRLG